MKHLSIFLKAVTVASLACAASLAAAQTSTTTLAVTANVSGVCKFSATTQPLAFGIIDPSLTVDKTMTADVKYKCTNKTNSLGIAGITGSHNMSSGSESLAYTLSIAGDAGAGLGFGTGKDLTATVTGTITTAQYQNAVAGSYSENVTLSFTP
ncbi:Spore Coat Protein U domain-containing protein [Polaromonas sp. OV174]|uniref:spore coat protein U domain-containing protein n=1 Tax=Polaromonas sp. OV174 TaxID=1855300 RepID=UPI0008F42146|nr:spore coat protein U domain-containing protein [Polaromonas sp. OV174]SFC14967.1 Spore Coat Protein U domain-containing protein [Polaromonas sp. OV174]